MVENHWHIQIAPYFPYPFCCGVQDVLIFPLGTAALNLNYHNEMCTFYFFLESSSQAKRLPYESQIHGGTFSKGSWIGEMKQASDRSVIISEILDPRTKNLLSMSKISDYVLSNELVSMALAMVAEDRQINDVLEELFAEEVIIL